MLKRYFSRSFNFKASDTELPEFYRRIFDDPANKLYKELYITRLGFDDKIEANREFALKSQDVIKRNEPIMRVSTNFCIDETSFYSNVIKSRSKHIKKLDEINQKLLDSKTISPATKSKLNSLLKMAFEMYSDYLVKGPESAASALLENGMIVGLQDFGDRQLQNMFSIRDIEKVLAIRSAMEIINEKVCEAFDKIDSEVFLRCLYAVRLHTLPLTNTNGVLNPNLPALLFPLKNLVDRCFSPNCFLHTYFDYPTDSEYLILKAERDIQPDESLSITCGHKCKINSQYRSFD